MSMAFYHTVITLFYSCMSRLGRRIQIGIRSSIFLLQEYDTVAIWEAYDIPTVFPDNKIPDR